MPGAQVGRPCRAFNLCLQPGERATAELCRVQDAISAAEEITGLAGLGLRYRDLVATDSAIIALAWPAGQVNELRGRLAERLRVPLQLSAGDMVHTTLFRYGGPLHDPASLLAALAGLDIQTEVGAAELLMIRERVFPALELDVLHRFPIMM